MPSNIEAIGGRALPQATVETERISADAPLRLDRAGGAFAVAKGFVDLFVMALADDEVFGARRHVLRVGEGGVVFGLPATAESALIAVGGLETEIQHLSSIEALTMPSRGGDPPLDGWIVALAEAAFGPTPAWPEGVVQTGAESECAEGSRLHAGRGVAWVSPRGGALEIMDDAGIVTEGAMLPLAAGLHLHAPAAMRYAACATTELAVARLPESLLQFHRLAADAIAARLHHHARRAEHRLAARETANSRTMDRAIRRLARIGHAPAGEAGELAEPNPLVFAFTMLAQRMGVALPPLPRTELDRATLPQLARLTGFGTRRVLLREAWWTRDNGPLIGIRGEDREPVALWPGPSGRYRILDGDGETTVTPQLAADLEAEATALYPPPQREVENLASLALRAFQGARRDLVTLLLMGLLGSALGAAVPIATGFLFEWVVPQAERGALAAVIGGLVLAAIGAAGFELVKSIALLRLESRMEAILQPLVMQRLLSLPVGFFRDFGAGDLTDRVLAIQRMRRLIAGTTITSLLAGGFAVVSLIVILVYSPVLALLAVGVVGLAGVITIALSLAQLRHERDAVRLGGREDGLVLQFIQAIGKLRVSASETRIFGLWADLFTRRRSALVQGQAFANLRATFYGSYPLIAALLLYRVASGMLDARDSAAGALSLGGFLAVSAAFGQLLAAIMAGGGALAGTLGAIPLFERLKPIVTTPPERRSDKSDPGPLSGVIEINRVSFRYAPEAPLVLEEVSLRVAPGEFVAIVGTSGSGKSTLQRLLLGFETAGSGDILYQGQSIGDLDPSALRRRIGVVLQNAKIMSGSIFENITAGLPYTLDDAWEAARLAGVAEDIEAMPMGMHSILMEGASTLSGGQLQRLMIARALIGRPQVLMFDEATSALDNISQAVVTQSLSRLHATRIVIAHRLSTIRDADRIFVLERGKLVESGSFESLMAQDGRFAAQARRQLL